ncbi:hypothetical protein WN51_03046 [Melipona quadrifasciata]|uniref:Uncharacterized protein n=1 Tax=Melipona quadrifasciata TaxID=166423 RepID=A0A0N0U499_9HYME|nr:hypothetical protein WN51_03046 [Melipona quadrifasciata]
METNDPLETKVVKGVKDAVEGILDFTYIIFMAHTLTHSRWMSFTHHCNILSMSYSRSTCIYSCSFGTTKDSLLNSYHRDLFVKITCGTKLKGFVDCEHYAFGVKCEMAEVMLKGFAEREHYLFQIIIPLKVCSGPTIPQLRVSNTDWHRPQVAARLASMSCRSSMLSKAVCATLLGWMRAMYKSLEVVRGNLCKIQQVRYFCSNRPRIPQIRVSNTRLAQAASGCAPSVDVLPIFDVKQQSVRNPARDGWWPALILRPRILQIRVSNTRLAQAASGCAPSVDVLPIFDVKQQSVRNPARDGWGPTSPFKDTGIKIVESLTSFPLVLLNFDLFSLLSIFKYNPGKMTNLLLLNNFYPVISYRPVRKEKRRIVVYGLVTRYGPQSVASASDDIIAIAIYL